ncbi:unnamed protein product [Didymodactylos carnosus]|uniref:NAD(P)(+)--arginine ADP-ribosyltransferase n=1 Tax=Didymodactylos carnosus TaxID=1234261 RepID=A0A814GPU2_9BILA|nr:unnamed protein product [Didymodactylos carnosus]CAF3770855.1 unnamed protein product [Didymodactylos carnosus]
MTGVLDEIVEEAIRGILEEGARANQQREAEIMAHQSREVNTYNNSQMIYDAVARLYTAESFLYRLINATLQENDLKKTNTLGVFCYLLRESLSYTDVRRELTVFRGGNLTQKELDSYKLSIGHSIEWSPLTSTTMNRHLAENCGGYPGNTLFIIHRERAAKTCKDVSTVSHYPDEEEVIFIAEHLHLVQSIRFDKVSKKHLIFLTDLYDYEVGHVFLIGLACNKSAQSDLVLSGANDHHTIRKATNPIITTSTVNDISIIQTNNPLPTTLPSLNN